MDLYIGTFCEYIDRMGLMVTDMLWEKLQQILLTYMTQISFEAFSSDRPKRKELLGFIGTLWIEVLVSVLL